MKYYPILIIVLGILFCTHLQSQDHHVELSRAFENSYDADICYYTLKYHRLKSNGDTVTKKFNVTLINNANDVSLSCHLNDSILEVYYNEVLLSANLKQSNYIITSINQKEIYTEPRYVFQPMMDPRLYNNLVDTSVQIEKISDSKDKCVFTITPKSPGELDILVHSVEVSKKTGKIVGFSYKASVAGIPLWENWELIDIEKCSKELFEKNDIKERFFDILKFYKPRCLQKNQSDSNSNQVGKNNNSINDTLPFLNLISIDGDTFQLSQVKSDFILVDYWYRACFPCIRSIPAINFLHDKYSEDKLKIISINNIDKSPDLIRKFISDNNVKSTVYTSSLEFNNRFEGITVYPTFVLYNNRFEIVKIFEGFIDNFQNKIIEQIENNK